MNRLEGIIKEAIERMVTVTAPDVYHSLKKSLQMETYGLARKQLETIMESADISSAKRLPICQDTGLITAYVSGAYCREIVNVKEGLERAIKELTREGRLRPNLVSPLCRKIVEDNVGLKEPEIYLDLNDTNDSIKLMLKGAGAENYTVLKMLLPSSSKHEINKFILKQTLFAGGKICPPSIVSLAIGGSPASVIQESKKALFRRIGERNADKELALWEEKLLQALNSLNIGPMGLGGKTTALDVKISVMGTHIAMMPVAVTYNCWALRRIQINKIKGVDAISW